MDLHTVDANLTGLTGAAIERGREQTNVTPTRDGREPHTDERAEASGAHRRDSAAQADQVEISDVSKVLAALSEQQDESGDLQLSTNKLRRMIEG
jgi:hypothetical protein